MKETPKTTCQICGRTIKANTGKIAHHGYKRPDYGWQTNSCMGARYLPYEQNRDRIPEVINTINGWMINAQTALDNLHNSPPETLTIEKHTGYAGKKVEYITVPRPDNFNPDTYDYTNAFSHQPYIIEFNHRVYKLEQEIKHDIEQIKRLQSRYDNWRLIND